MAGEGWAEYGKPAGGEGGEPKVERQEKQGDKGPAPDVVQITKADYERLTAAAKKVESLPDMSSKFEVVDKLVKVFAGDPKEVATKQGYLDVMKDLKEVARHSNPAFYKLLQMMEADPDVLDRFTGQVDELTKREVFNINSAAHDRIIQQAKVLGFKAANATELAEMMFPYEVAVTRIIESNPEVKRAYLSGNISVVDDILKKLTDPTVKARLREKEARVAARKFPLAPPRGGAEPGATAADKETKRPDIRTPRGKMDFHKGAVDRWLNKLNGNEE